jgi:hypothetical protein
VQEGSCKLSKRRKRTIFKKYRNKQKKLTSFKALTVNFFVDFLLGVSPKMDSMAESRSSSCKVLNLRVAASGDAKRGKDALRPALCAEDRLLLVVRARVSRVVVERRNIIIIVETSNSKRNLVDPRITIQNQKAARVGSAARKENKCIINTWWFGKVEARLWCFARESNSVGCGWIVLLLSRGSCCWGRRHSGGVWWWTEHQAQNLFLEDTNGASGLERRRAAVVTMATT